MSRSVFANVNKVTTNDEEEEFPSSGPTRYIARTIPTNTPFFNSSNQRNQDRYNRTNQKELRNPTLTAPTFKTSQDLPSAAAEKPGEFSNDFDEEPEYQDASEYISPDTFRTESEDLEVHGPDHYGRLEAEPTRDSQDRLWTEIDALDDVKRLAQEVNLYDGFPPGFEEQLIKIRESHAHLLKAMRDRNARIEEERRHEITSPGDSHANSNDHLNRHTTGSFSRIISNATAGADTATAGGTPIAEKQSHNIDRDYMGPIVQANEDRYVQEMIDNIKSIRM